MDATPWGRGAVRVAGVVALTLALLPWSAVEIVAYAEVPEVVARKLTFRTDASMPRTAALPDTWRSEPSAAGARFSSVGFELPEGAEARFRVAAADGQWDAWSPVPLLDEHEGPDPGSPEAVASEGRAFSDALWVGDASRIQIQVAGARPEEVEATLIDAAGLNDAGTVRVRVRTSAAEAAPADRLRPAIVTRAEWGADESLRGHAPSYASRAGAGIVHHTAGKNDYSAGDVPAILRGIYYYHTKSRGWSDIGYNFLVDRFGRVFEGRYGGMDRAVIGAHASGYNTGSIGISVMGNFANGLAAVPTAAVDGVARTLAWKFAVHGIDPYGSFRFPTGGSVRPALLGHTDVGSTSCPGDIQRQLSALKGRIADAMLPFRDVLAGGAHYDAIARLWYEGMVSGCSSDLFCPWGTLTRAQAATMISGAFGIPGSDVDRFHDVDPGSPHRRAINGLVEAGLIGGFADGGFHPSQTLTRAQLASILRGVLGLEPVAGDRFADVPAGSVHGGSVYALNGAGVLGGCEVDRYCPAEPILRAQMASMVNGSLDWQAAQVPVEPPAEEPPAEEPTEQPIEEATEDPAAAVTDPADQPTEAATEQPHLVGAGA